MHDKRKKLCGVAVVALMAVLIFNSAYAANQENYKNQELTHTVSEEVAELTAGTKGSVKIHTDNDGVVDIYMSFDNYKKALELSAEQVDANTENIALESDEYNPSKIYRGGGTVH